MIFSYQISTTFPFICFFINRFLAYLNGNQFELVSRYRDPQLQSGSKLLVFVQIEIKELLLMFIYILFPITVI